MRNGGSDWFEGACHSFLASWIYSYIHTKKRHQKWQKKGNKVKNFVKSNQTFPKSAKVCWNYSQISWPLSKHASKVPSTLAFSRVHCMLRPMAKVLYLSPSWEHWIRILWGEGHELHIEKPGSSQHATNVSWLHLDSLHTDGVFLFFFFHEQTKGQKVIMKLWWNSCKYLGNTKKKRFCSWFTNWPFWKKKHNEIQGEKRRHVNPRNCHQILLKSSPLFTTGFIHPR